MGIVQNVDTPMALSRGRARPSMWRIWRHRGSSTRGQNAAGWLFVAPALGILLVFLVIPIGLALYVSFTNWSGITSPFGQTVQGVGFSNYRALLTEPGLNQQLFGTDIRNNLYFVLFTVPLQTLLALWLAIVVNNRFLKGRGLFRLAFYFPSVTSSVAITTVFIFLFQGSGAVNKILSVFGIRGPNWLYDARGVFTVILNNLGVHNAPGWAGHAFLGISIWQWIAGPSFGMCVLIILLTWTTSGTFMLLFIAALQGVSLEVEEASEIDGATPWQRFRHVTVPMLRPAIVLVLTLGLISTWQLFDQVTLVGPYNQTTWTPAYLSYYVSFQNNEFGQGAAIAFLLFALIVILTLIQRRFVKEDLTK